MSLGLRASYGVFLIPRGNHDHRVVNSPTDGPLSLLLLRYEGLACVVLWPIFACAAVLQPIAEVPGKNTFPPLRCED
jgi:hypothetical protein